jgi:two-component system sensor histidine kinase KdpD
VPPLYSFAVDDIRFLFTFSVYLIVAGVTSTIASSLHSQLDKAKKSELLTRTLYDVSRQMVVLTDSQKILEIFAQRIAENMRGKIIFLLPDSQNDRLTEAASSPFGSVLASEDERGIAQWVLAHGRGAGKGTGIIGNSSALFLPVKAENRTLAVLAIIPAEGDDPALPERYTLLEAFTNLAAVGLIRVALAQEAQRASWLAQSEKLHSALLNSVSHEIRTPLSSITGAVTSLLERIGMDHESRDTLLCTIKEEAQRMNRFVSNLLDMTRLESGMLKPNEDWCDIQDVIGVAIREIRDLMQNHPLEVHVPAELPLVRADFALIEHVLINLLENAAKYSPPGGDISISAYKTGNELLVRISNAGPAIPVLARRYIFDKFRRPGESEKQPGVGLGHSICKGIMEAHGGKI